MGGVGRYEPTCVVCLIRMQANEHIGRRHTILLRNLLYERLLEQICITRSEGRVRSEDDMVLQALVHDFLLRLLAVWMELDLIHCWDDACFEGQEIAQEGN